MPSFQINHHSFHSGLFIKYIQKKKGQLENHNKTSASSTYITLKHFKYLQDARILGLFKLFKKVSAELIFENLF